MRYQITHLLGLALALGFAACGGGGGSSSDHPQGGADAGGTAGLVEGGTSGSEESSGGGSSGADTGGSDTAGSSGADAGGSDTGGSGGDNGAAGKEVVGGASGALVGQGGDTAGGSGGAEGFELGVPCGGDGECASGYCVEGVCCDGECEGTCESCVTDGAHGTCAPLPGGTVCGTSTCAADYCDGTTFYDLPEQCELLCDNVGECASTCDGCTATEIACDVGTANDCCEATCSPAGGCSTVPGPCAGVDSCGTNVLSIGSLCTGCGLPGANGVCAAGSTRECSNANHTLCEQVSCDGTLYSCTEVDGEWQWRDAAACDDGDACTYDDLCIGGPTPTCAGTPLTCEDDSTTCGAIRSCNGTATCTETFPGASTPCDDGIYCNGEDACSGDGTCGDHSGNPCASDGLFCNGAEACNEASDSCTHSGNPCGDDGFFCNGAESCNETSDSCDHSGDPCDDDGLFCNGAESCNETSDACEHTGDPCGDDGLFCNGAESCNETSDSCDHSGDPCGDDGLFCNGAESCNETSDACEHTGAPCSDDGLFCNGAESCNETSDACEHAGDPCGDDGLFCNGAESCNEGSDVCEHTGSPCTDDGLFCNGAESCNESTNACESAGDPCSNDGLFCNGTESCNETSDACEHTGDPCEGQVGACNAALSCDESSDSCDEGTAACGSHGVCLDEECICDEGWSGDDCGRCVVYVDGNTGDDGNAGNSWSSAARTVPRGILLAEYYGDCEVWVAQGTYTPTETTDETLSIEMLPNIDLYGGFVGGETARDQREWMVFTTTLSGDLAEGGNSDRVVTGADNTILDGFTIADASGEVGMYNQDVTVTVRNCTFHENRAGSRRAALYNRDAHVTLDNCSVTGSLTNSETDVRNLGTGSFYAVDSNFTGGIYNNAFSGPFEIQRCEFRNARNSAIRITPSGTLIEDSTFVGNMDCNWGGAIYATSDTTIRNTSFVDNDAGSYLCGSYYQGSGGAVYVSQGNMVIEDCYFWRNAARQADSDPRGGGAIYSSSSANTTIRRSAFVGNYAGGEGGAIHLRGPSIIEDSSFSGDRSDLQLGDAVFTYNLTKMRNIEFDDFWHVPVVINDRRTDQSDPTEVDTCVFSNNRAGGILIYEEAHPWIVNSTFINNANSARAGGAIHVYSGGGGTIDGCIFEHNASTRQGGAIYGSPDAIINSVFEGNKAASDGGALYLTGGTTTTTLINGASLHGNMSQGGGAIHCSGRCQVDLQNSVVYNNTPVEIDAGTGTVDATYSNIRDGGFPGAGVIDADNSFNNAPLETSMTSSLGTTTTVELAYSDILIFNGFIIEVGDDGVARTVTSVNNEEVTFTPALDAAPATNTRVDVWGPGVTNLDIDLLPAAGSPCIDAANGDTAPEFDLLGVNRQDDPNTPNTGVGTPDYADMGCYEYSSLLATGRL